MEINFTKYQGTGNDFIMVDNLDGKYSDLTIDQIVTLCNRKTGIGADGLIKISQHDALDFEVEYYNADGSQSFCGNGARCSVAFAKELGLIQNETSFYAIDGQHKASIKDGLVEIDMLPVKEVKELGADYFLDTGSPHYIKVLDGDGDIDIIEFGRLIRYSEQFKKEGVNVNTMRLVDKNHIKVETYERGVEDETLSCGTGVTACALLLKKIDETSGNSIKITTKGGTLFVRSDKFDDGKGFNNIWLSGPAKRVFKGIVHA